VFYPVSLLNGLRNFCILFGAEQSINFGGANRMRDRRSTSGNRKSIFELGPGLSQRKRTKFAIV